MVRVRVRHFNVVEAELKAAADEALRIAIPLRAEGGALKLAGSSGAQQNSTENRWLGRMVTNTLSEVRARADTYDASGALLKEAVAGVAEEVEKLGESKKRKRAEVEELRKKAKAVRNRVLKEVELETANALISLRPEADAGASEPPAPAPSTAAAEGASAVLKGVGSLHARAKKCAAELGAKSEALAGRIDSFRETAGAVSSFLRSKPSRVEQAIRQSTRRQQEARQEEEGKEGGGKGKLAKAPASGVSALADHVAPVAAAVNC